MNEDSLIVVDSCCEIPNEYENVVPIVKVPFHILSNGKDYLDDGSIVRKELLEDMASSKEATKSACPSPDDFLNAYNKIKKAQNIFVVTVSAKLSGAYNSAMLAKELLIEKCHDKFIHVFDSMGASATEMNVVMKINEYIKELNKEINPKDVVDKITNYINNLNTYFVLQNYDNFVKSGRISKAKVVFANYLNIFPIMKGNNGLIELADKARGLNKALTKMVDAMSENVPDLAERTLSITHCNAQSVLETVLELIEERKYQFKNIIINETDGLSTMYAMDGGIIISY